MRNMWTVMIAVILGLGLSARAASVSYVGLDQTTHEAWGSTSVAKPGDADSYYGTDGWRVLNNYKQPVYGSINDPIGYFWSYGDQIDDPGQVPAADVPNTTVGCQYGPQAGNGNWVPVWTVTLTQAAAFRMSIITDVDWSGADYSPIGMRVYLQGDQGNAVAATDTLGGGNLDIDYVQFDVSGQAGDVFIVDLQGGGSWWVHTAGLLLDPAPVPEPATMSLLALGGLAALRRRRK
ncbi:MAG: PEP-CTERM sorting domain-containing protein [Planctomycetaceae bacterium]|nr:PEP-CTERM sorting domain-containing protein [Planctomycetaceae bacterium]